MPCLTEKLIKAVKKYPILYDCEHDDYGDAYKTERIWKKIALGMNEKSEELKEKWKEMKDTYCKYLESMNTDESDQSNWQWATSMEFFEPFMLVENPNSEGDDKREDGLDTDTDDSSDSSQCSIDSQTKEVILEAIERNDRKRKRKRRASRSEERECRKRIKLGAKAIDMIFMGYAKIVKSFSPSRQAETKIQITRVMLEQEMLHINETLNT